MATVSTYCRFMTEFIGLLAAAWVKEYAEHGRRRVDFSRLLVWRAVHRSFRTGLDSATVLAC
jgi:hypothetical protein